MAESNGRRNGRMTGMAGMAERQKEWNGGMAEWREWQNGGNGRMAERMAEWQNGRNGYIRTIYGTHRRRHRRHLLIFYTT